MTIGPRVSPDSRVRIETNSVRLEVIEDAVPLGIWTWSRASGVMRPSRGLYRILRLDPDAPPLSADLIAALIHEDDRAALDERRAAMLGGRGLAAQHSTYRLVLGYGVIRRYSEHAQVESTDAGGLRTSVVAVVRDVTDEDARATASSVGGAALSMNAATAIGIADAAEFLCETAQLLASSLELDDTLRTIGHLAVPRLADWCIIDLVDGFGALRTASSVATTDDTAAILQALRERHPPSPFELDDPRRRALLTGRSSLVSDVALDAHTSLARDGEELALMRRLGQTSRMIVPLAARGQLTGAITLATGASKRRFTPRDLLTAEQLATLAAFAIDNARLYDIARGRTVLPDPPADVEETKENTSRASAVMLGLEHLSERERKVLGLAARGFTAVQMGEKLFLSPKTIETYRARAMRKLGLETRAELVALAIRVGLLSSV